MLDFISTLAARFLEPLSYPEAGPAMMLVAAWLLQAYPFGSGKKRKPPSQPDAKRQTDHHHCHIHLWMGE